jgi:hypothetical protein
MVQFQRIIQNQNGSCDAAQEDILRKQTCSIAVFMR